jgi:hypothetical protein
VFDLLLDVTARYYGGQRYVLIVPWFRAQEAECYRQRSGRSFDECREGLDHAAANVDPTHIVNIQAKRFHEMLGTRYIQLA